MNRRWSQRAPRRAIVMMVAMCMLIGALTQIAYADESINFPNTSVGQTQVIPFTYTLSESSGTSAMVTVSPPSAPFSVSEPYSFSLNPGQSRTLNVSFSPTSAGPQEGAFSITAIGGFPPQIMTTHVSLTGTGVTGFSLSDLLGPFTEVDPTPEATELELMEVKLDEAEVALADLRQRLDNLGWWLGRLTNGAPLRLGPYDTNPMPQTDTWTQLQLLEAKLDSLLEQPADITLVEIYNIIVQINILMVEINQWVINLGGDVSLLEAKIDTLLAQPSEITIVEVYDIVVQINILIVQINQWIIEIGSDVSGLETKLDQLQVDIDAITESIADLQGSLDAILAEIRANGDATARLEAKIDAGERAVAALEVKADAAAAALAANGAAIAANGAAIGANAAGIAANGAAIGANAGAIAANGAAIGANAAGIAANGVAIGANGAAVAANGAAIAGNAAAIAANAAAIAGNAGAIAGNNAAILANNAAIMANGRGIAANGAAIAALDKKVDELKDSNNRIEDKLHQVMRALGIPAPPPTPDASLITFTMGGGPLPGTPLEATIDGAANSVLPSSLVMVYWGSGLPPSTVTADGSGAFTLVESTGITSYSSVEVTQTDSGGESAPIRVSSP